MNVIEPRSNDFSDRKEYDNDTNSSTTVDSTEIQETVNPQEIFTNSTEEMAIHPEDAISEKALSRKSTKLEDKLSNVHDNMLPIKELIICFLTLSCSLFVSFCDQSSVTIALPLIARDLNAADSINWAGTASLLANTVCQVLYGRISDIYGRKNILLVSILILFAANLLCGFASSGPEFYFFRALAGIGAGGIQSLTMVITSDSVSLKERGKYQGILGTSVGLGNVVGPLVMGALIEHSTWRTFYRIFPGIILFMFVIVFFFVKSKPQKELNSVLSNKQKLLKIDYVGILLSCAGLVLILVPMSGGGITFAWNSTIVIVMFCIGGLCLVVFVVYELKVPELPMIPISAMKSITLTILLLSNFLFGAGYYGFFFMMPYYFQIVKGYSAMKTAILYIPMLLTQSFMSTLAGTTMSFTGHYIYIIGFGYIVWVCGLGSTLKWDLNTQQGLIVGSLVMVGTGAGFIFQPSIVAIQANCKKAQRAVIIGFRNVLRSFGGAFGIAVASLIVSNSFEKQIKAQLEANILPVSFLQYTKLHVFTHPDMTGFTVEQVIIVRQMYMTSIMNAFYFFLALLVAALFTCFVVKDDGLHCIDEAKPTKSSEKSESV